MDSDPTQPMRKQRRPANSTNPDEAAKAPHFDQPDHSMLDEEPDGWDLAPADIHDPRMKRHPRKEGKGGTPDPRDKHWRIE